MDELKKRADGLHENNPMMGHRGVRLGITYPEVTEMQVRAILEAAAELIKDGKKAYPGDHDPGRPARSTSSSDQKAIVDKVYAEVWPKLRPQEDRRTCSAR